MLIKDILREAIVPEVSTITPQQYASDIISGKSKPWQDEHPAYYDADFGQPGEIPYFNMIFSKVRGLGFIAFLDFLRHVGSGNIFTSSDFTPAGKTLFEKAVSKGLLTQMKAQSGLGRKTEWKVLADTKPLLQQIANTK